MTLFLWDASALVKHYFHEVGSETVDALFASVATTNMASTPWGYAESYSILLRRSNGGVLNDASFIAAVSSLQAEVVDSADFLLLTISDTAIFRSVSVMQKHNLNATDAAILTVVLEVARSLDAPTCVVVASDQRLLRAAQAEGLRTLNPEVTALADVPAFLATL